MVGKILRIALILSLISTQINHSALAQIALPNPEYLNLISQKVDSYISYPDEALENGWEGIARVNFTIDQDGQIKDIYIAESSGYPLLDAQAMFAIQDASPYPFPEDYTEGQEIEVTIPVSYARPAMEVPEYAEPGPADQDPALRETEDTAQEDITLFSSMDDETSAAANLESAPTVGEPVPEEIVMFDLWSEHAPSQEVPEPGTELSDFLDQALRNNQPTKLAKEEVELAQLKITEAKRGFLPNLKLTGYDTKGEVYKIEYEERELKAEADQPIYAGGRLKDTLRQAKVNLEVSKRNYDRLKIDVMHKTETAYYNLVAAKMHLKEKEALQAEAQDIVTKIEKLANSGMVIPLELDSSRSWLEQIGLQISNLKQDLFMAELTFKQVLNVQELPKVDAGSLAPKKLAMALADYQQIALKNRPEVYLSALLVKFNEYGRKIEESKANKMTVDLVGSYGRYSGHYKTEAWTESDNWYAGLKASIPWGPNTVNSSYTKESSQPKFGQTSPTASSTISTELNILDNFKRISDKKRANIDFDRALSDYSETAKTIAFEVQDAFLNYQKAVLQLDTAQAEMKFRRNETEINKIRAMVAETSISSAIESLYSYAEAQTKYFQALTAFQLALVNLKKACGYGIKIGS